jgi:hypothetical protein
LLIIVRIKLFINLFNVHILILVPLLLAFYPPWLSYFKWTKTNLIPSLQVLMSVRPSPWQRSLWNMDLILRALLPSCMLRPRSTKIRVLNMRPSRKRTRMSSADSGALEPQELHPSVSTKNRPWLRKELLRQQRLHQRSKRDSVGHLLWIA